MSDETETVNVMTSVGNGRGHDAASAREWGLIIGGRRVAAREGGFYEKVSPVTEEPLCKVPDATAADVDAAVTAAQEAYVEWRDRDLAERARIVRHLATILREHKEELAYLDAVDVGNAYTPMLLDVEFGAQGLEHMADLATQLRGETQEPTSRLLHYTRREPIGVVARIVAFNHPIMFAAQKVAAPLVAGNAVVLKPSDISPLSALRMGELFADALPPGLLSVVVGQGPDVPRALVRDRRVRRIGFIGSEPTGRAIQREAAEVAVKDVTLELGGKNAIIVCPDVDVAAAAEGVVKGMNFVGWQSQSCSSTSRLLVHESIADQLVEQVVRRIGEIRIGSPIDAATEMGTLANSSQYEKVMSYISAGKDEGARLVVGGGRPAGAGFERGYFVEPTVFDHITEDMCLASEEVFGPVLSVIRWSDEADAIRIANSVAYGLTASVWTRDIGRAHAMARRLEAGFLWINDAASHYTGVPFGGIKASGIGREESIEELLSYTQLKTVNLRMDYEL